MNEEHLNHLKQNFSELFRTPPQKIVTSPGRAEIIGNHTDYNNGFAIAACIENNFVFLSSPRTDNIIRAASTSFNGTVISFEITDKIAPESVNTWNNYLRGVAEELQKSGYIIHGCDILIDSNVPLSGGVSSSAALELGVAYTILDVTPEENTANFRTKIARICQLAENRYINSPCGFLDQAAVALGDKDKMVYLDFMPKGDMPVSDVQQIPAELGEYEFILSVDPKVKRQLGLSGYPARRKMCEESLPLWSKLLGKKISSLRDVTINDFQQHKDYFEKLNPVMRQRIEHVVFENDRVLQAKNALAQGDINKFGALLTASGKSALELYELDEKTPELTFLLKESLNQKDVLGSRNMGGGFSAIIITLLKRSAEDEFKSTLNQAYKQEFDAELEFIKFKAEQGITFKTCN